MTALTSRARIVLDAITAHTDEHGLPPTLRELIAACNVSSTSVMVYHLDRLSAAGLITRERYKSRTIRLTALAGEVGA